MRDRMQKDLTGLKETVRLLVRYVVKVGRRVRDLERTSATDQMQLVYSILEKQNTEIAKFRGEIKTLQQNDAICRSLDWKVGGNLA